MRRALFILALFIISGTVSAKEITMETAIANVKKIAEAKYCFSEESSVLNISMSYWDKLIPASCIANGFGKCKIMRNSRYSELRKELSKNPFWHIVIKSNNNYVVDDSNPLEFFIGTKDGKVVEGPNNPSHFPFCASTKKQKEPLLKIFIYASKGELKGIKKIASYISKKDINIVKDNDTPLSLATKSGNYDLVKFLTEKGADVNLKCPILEAISAWNNDILDYFISKGADINCSENSTYYPLDIARVNCNKYAIEILEKKSAKEKGDWKTKKDHCNF